MLKPIVSALALLSIGSMLPAKAAADPIDAWRGRLFTCGSHPTVQIPAPAVAYAYEKDLTHYTQGTVAFGRSSATVTFPGRYGSFTLEKRKTGYVVGGQKCTVDNV